MQGWGSHPKGGAGNRGPWCASTNRKPPFLGNRRKPGESQPTERERHALEGRSFRYFQISDDFGYFRQIALFLRGMPGAEISPFSLVRAADHEPNQPVPRRNENDSAVLKRLLGMTI